ncbi:Ubiquitin recognition factor in ER-associated degradation protein 1 [Schistosoma japonicum]|nr:Ubiquitin recognition factor in ER-associated degradation protein 1 [Schistosoma japonicum]
MSLSFLHRLKFRRSIWFLRHCKMVFFHRIDNSSPFTTSYRCYPVSFLADNFRSSVEKGGKIIMPPSALDVLTRLNVQYPMLFKLTNQQANRTTHCGVLEFVADEGRIYVPYWMLKNLHLEEGGLVSVVNAALPVASFARFQPQSTDFLDISNPKAVLENALRDFACLTVGDIIAISYNERIYELKVLETKPKDAVTIIECDMSVDFAPPVGYQSTDSGSLSKLDNVDAHQVYLLIVYAFRALFWNVFPFSIMMNKVIHYGSQLVTTFFRLDSYVVLYVYSILFVLQSPYI